MKSLAFAMLFGATFPVGPALAEVEAADVATGPEQVWIEVIEGGEVMWVGPNEFERTQVLSAPDIEIVARITDADTVRLVGAKAFVAVIPASHTCDDLSEPLQYFVVTLGATLATDGPLTTCGPLKIAATAGAIQFERDPMGEGEFWAWLPGQGFKDRLK